ncbi:hypothetical protein C3744_27770 [Priestia megaterium]|uniref:Uncharacterized protein n=1 Tax=Priestia megaterium TaxID=1404 RepID=A0A3D8WUG6_PRIMG|nr:hypothetical protein C3744_27770 [Priestia megaterium]
MSASKVFFAPTVKDDVKLRIVQKSIKFFAVQLIVRSKFKSRAELSELLSLTPDNMPKGPIVAHRIPINNVLACETGRRIV